MILTLSLPTFLGIIGAVYALSPFRTEFQFTRMADTFPESSGRKILRQNGIFVPHLFEGDEILLRLCASQNLSIQVANINYSNDGLSDTVLVRIDGKDLGQFESHFNSDWGNLWEKPLESGPIGGLSDISPGSHEILIKVMHSLDCYGVELWSMQISADADIDAANFWCAQNVSFASRQPDCLSSSAQERSTTTAVTTTLQKTTKALPSVVVTQHSKASDCLDTKNVKVSFSTANLNGTRITVRQNDNKVLEDTPKSLDARATGRMCEQTIWQLGKIDGDNTEFMPVFPGETIEINITAHEKHEAIFPAKILPFVTKNMRINFKIPHNIKEQVGSAYFTLGLINLTKTADVAFQYYDHSTKSFSSVHVMSFTPEYAVMGWNIPNFAKTNDTDNTFLLHFTSSGNMIMFDFLKLEYVTNDERKLNILIGRSAKWKVRGLRYPDSVGMLVSVDDAHVEANIEEVILMCKSSDFNVYNTVLRVAVNGIIYPYKTYKFTTANSTEKSVVDVSGFFAHQISNLSKTPYPSEVLRIKVETSKDELAIHYRDGSFLQLRLAAPSTETEVIIKQFETKDNESSANNIKSLVFVSTYVSEYLAAINSIRGINTQGVSEREKHIMDDLSVLSGENKYILKKKSPTQAFYTNNEFLLQFPGN